MEEIDSLENAIKFIKHKFNMENFNLSAEDMEAYNILLDQFIETNSSNSSTRKKGKSLENLVNFLLERTGIFDIYKNLRTNSNELDQLVRCNEMGRLYISNGLLDNRLNHFIGECKNYRAKVSVTHVGKICSLLSTTQNKMCILFSYKGVSGSGWVNASGLIKKFYLSKEYEQERFCIIDFNIDDFKKIKDGDNIINNKIFSLQNDVDYSKFIKSHKLEKTILELQQKDL